MLNAFKLDANFRLPNFFRVLFYVSGICMYVSLAAYLLFIWLYHFFSETIFHLIKLILNLFDLSLMNWYLYMLLRLLWSEIKFKTTSIGFLFFIIKFDLKWLTNFFNISGNQLYYIMFFNSYCKYYFLLFLFIRNILKSMLIRREKKCRST